MPPKDAKKEIDPEELMKRKFKAKCNFRALGRMVMSNAYWLIEGIDQYEGVEDVKRRVEQAVRTKAKKQLLSIKDKALLNKPVLERTDNEKKYLYRIIGGLKCFKRYPNHVKKKLAALTYFLYFGPDRVIVRQHQEAHALYFIVSGEVIVTQMVFDELLEVYQSVEIGRMYAGDMFGEVSLLHNIPRSATVTTADHCEFLQLLKEDFKKVLLTSVQKQWDEVKAAMSLFTYFEQLDEVSSREGCIVAKMKKYAINETIYGDGCGIPNHVYFILSGVVQMVESLQIVVVQGLTKTFYYLYDPYVSKETSEEDFDQKWFSVLNRESRQTSFYKSRSSIAGKKSSLTSKSMTSKSVGIDDKQEGEEGVADSAEQKIDEEAKPDGEIKTESDAKPQEEVKAGEAAKTKEAPRTDEAIKGGEAVKTDEAVKGDEMTALPDVVGQDDIMVVKAEETDEGQPRRSSVNWEFKTDERSLSRKISVPPLHPHLVSGRGKLRTYFMQVCRMNPGSTFGFGENMRDRRMIALTPVSCMLMPKVWLLQRNTANIWTRIQYYLGKKIPNKAKLFEEFQKQRDWLVFREERLQDVIQRSTNVNNTSTHDVPYAIRLDEMVDI